jgi:hypothetical protein
VSRRVRSAVAVTGLAATLLCSGCTPALGGSDDDRAAVSADTVQPDPVAEQISQLEQSKQELQGQIDALRTPSSTPTSGTEPATGASASATAQDAVVTSVADPAAGFAVQFAAVERSLGGSSGIVVVPVGSGGQPLSGGTLTTAVAWSTIKVPLAVAAVRAEGGRPSPGTAALIKRAITLSDNAAAESLWAKLGSSTEAATAVSAVLRDAGDATTRVQSRRIRAGFTPFGQTEWPLARQALVAAHLTCLNGAGPVLTTMGQITASQRWGLGRIGSGTRFKGGWGPGDDGRYLARQFGIVALPHGGQVAVAIATRPADGSFGSATAHLDAIAGWLRGRLPSLTGGHC